MKASPPPRTASFPRLSASAYAILGLIVAAPGSAYELSKRMDLTYAYFWPRARSGVFADVKRLAELGLVRGETSATGRRERTVYAVTPRGKRVLRAWLATPPATFALEIEALVRVYLADFGDRPSLDASLAAVEREAEGMVAIARDIIPAYLEGRAPGPADDVVSRALLIDFLAGFASFTRDWARRSRREVARWSSRETRAARVRRARSALRKAMPRA